jgi:cytochrome c oxidase subunit II
VTAERDERGRAPRNSRLGLMVAIVVWALGIGVFVLGARRYLPPVASRHGEGIDVMLIYLLVTTGTLVAIGHLILGYFILRFSGAGAVSTELPGGRAQRFWSVAPALVMTLVAEGGVLVLGIPVFDQITKAPPADSLVIEVTGEQFTWNVRYPGPDGRFGRTDPHLIAVDNPLGIDPADPASADDIHELALMYVPVDKPVHIRLRSKDVLHSFFLPYHRVKQDAVPGMTIDLWFVPTRVGEFDIVCAELCGFGHYQMRAFLHVVSDAEFQQWLAEKRKI